MINLLFTVTVTEWLWFVANLLTGASYILIPIEIVRWFRGVNVLGMKGVGRLFFYFILACGSHHLLMVRFVGHHPVDAWQLFVDSNMMVASVLAAVALAKNRDRIRGVILFVARCLRNREAVEAALRG